MAMRQKNNGMAIRNMNLLLFDRKCCGTMNPLYILPLESQAGDLRRLEDTKGRY